MDTTSDDTKKVADKTKTKTKTKEEEEEEEMKRKFKDLRRRSAEGMVGLDFELDEWW